jgi:hypothetical protein
MLHWVVYDWVVCSRFWVFCLPLQCFTQLLYVLLTSRARVEGMKNISACGKIACLTGVVDSMHGKSKPYTLVILTNQDFLRENLPLKCFTFSAWASHASESLYYY